MRGKEEATPKKTTGSQSAPGKRETASNKPTAERPTVEAYDPHFGSHLTKKDSYWRI